MKKIIIFFFILIAASCTKKEIPKKDFCDKVIDFAIENSNGNYIELSDLYESSSKINKDDEEKSILVQKLKARGFKIINWGRGNHPLGPRIIVYKLQNNIYECEVDKIYYSTSIDSEFHATERIRCNMLK